MATSFTLDRNSMLWIFFLGEKVTFTLDESPLDAVFGWFLPKQNFQSCEECCFIVFLFKGYSKVALFLNSVQ